MDESAMNFRRNSIPHFLHLDPPEETSISVRMQQATAPFVEKMLVDEEQTGAQNFQLNLEKVYHELIILLTALSLSTCLVMCDKSS
ncbi:hypothetical protein WR25_13977 [Diploscapter pachys]|uniref:Uncharacterized protein n=1 Tax=Diploscapter pachys TaxID=2018661 RepID=A0A2A2M0H5_9BILA|nr:hypothetical protein WR25_13977 [Diploscapter pachys]